MQRPAGLDPNFFVDQGLKDKEEEEAVRRSAGEALKKIDPAAALRIGVP